MPSAVDYITLLPEGKQGPIPVPEGSWNKNTTYVRTDYKVPFVEHNKLYYLLMKPESIGVNPKEDYAQNGMNATWVLIPSYEMVIVQALVANGGSIGGAHYMQSNNQDYMISKKGTNLTTGEPDTNFTDFPHNFEPNWWVNFTTGDSGLMNSFVRGVVANDFVNIRDAAFLEQRVLDVKKNTSIYSSGYGGSATLTLPSNLEYAGFKVTVYNAGGAKATTNPWGTVWYHHEVYVKTEGERLQLGAKKTGNGKIERIASNSLLIEATGLVEFTAVPIPSSVLESNEFKLNWVVNEISKAE